MDTSGRSEICFQPIKLGITTGKCGRVRFQRPVSFHVRDRLPEPRAIAVRPNEKAAMFAEGWLVYPCAPGVHLTGAKQSDHAYIEHHDIGVTALPSQTILVRGPAANVRIASGCTTKRREILITPGSKQVRPDSPEFLVGLMSRAA